MFGVEVDVVNVEVDQFSQADTGAQEQLDDEPVSAGDLRGPAPQFFRQPPLLGLGQEGGGGAWQPPQGHRPGRVIGDLSGLLRPGEKRPDGRLEAVQRGRGPGRAGGRVDDRRRGQRLVDQGASDAAQGQPWVVLQQDGCELPQVPQVRADGVRGATLGSQPSGEGFDRLLEGLRPRQEPKRARRHAAGLLPFSRSGPWLSPWAGAACRSGRSRGPRSGTCEAPAWFS